MIAVFKAVFATLFTELLPMLMDPERLQRGTLTRVVAKLKQGLLDSVGDNVGAVRISRWLEKARSTQSSLSRHEAVASLRKVFPTSSDIVPNAYKVWGLAEIDKKIAKGISNWNDASQAAAPSSETEPYFPKVTAVGQVSPYQSMSFTEQARSHYF
ncbi:Oidioi.mRNA.OKI2018_I69.YSR.g17112.t1.cds [Oikopleura dioica]|uniref:Oidioi.mRNA.OKI2018_I69.YSR.g17112.t1.cds n=1 Tax=Oikopleura dioica TaxID=34765 RepID=A0ABN7SIP9_OIKDI|nr:Oidioi.mRNA.OKI2018_I69.YSR.g17112.t1.cds [Oikopleura dioica]